MTTAGYPRRIDPRPCSRAQEQQNWQAMADVMNNNGLMDMDEIGAAEDPAYVVGIMSDGTFKKIPTSSAPTRLNGVRISQMNGYTGAAEQVMIKRTNDTLGYDDSGAC